MNKIYMYAVAKEKMKMKVDFVCPLSTQSIKILKQIEPFSKYRGNTLNKLGYQDKHTFHGFRSMFSTIAYKNMVFILILFNLACFIKKGIKLKQLTIENQNINILKKKKS